MSFDVDALQADVERARARGRHEALFAVDALAQALDVIRELRQQLDARIGQAKRLSFMIERTQRQRDQLWTDLVELEAEKRRIVTQFGEAVAEDLRTGKLRLDPSDG